MPGQLISGALTNINSPTPDFARLGSHPLTGNAIGDRGAVDLYITGDGPNSWKVYSVATSDPGALGPFRSSIYLAGRLTVDACSVLRTPTY